MILLGPKRVRQPISTAPDGTLLLAQVYPGSSTAAPLGTPAGREGECLQGQDMVVEAPSVGGPLGHAVHPSSLLKCSLNDKKDESLRTNTRLKLLKEFERAEETIAGWVYLAVLFDLFSR